MSFDVGKSADKIAKNTNVRSIINVLGGHVVSQNPHLQSALLSVGRLVELLRSGFSPHPSNFAHPLYIPQLRPD